jgi:hypothetical protein
MGEDTPLTIRAFRSGRGLVEGLALIVAACLGLIGIAGCAAPAYTYVADSADSTYYKVPAQWHPISQSSLAAELSAEGGSGSGIWISAYDGTQSPTAQHFLAFNVSKPFLFSEVGELSSDESNELSYNGLRDFLFPVTSTAREEEAESGDFPLTNFQQIRDDTITSKDGVHGVRETFQYTYQGVADTFDEDALTNADQTIVYFLIVHCTASCYNQNESAINTVMSSFTVGSSS